MRRPSSIRVATAFEGAVCILFGMRGARWHARLKWTPIRHTVEECWFEGIIGMMA